MNKSEILLVMVGGMATVAGGVLAAYIAFLGGDDPVKQVEFAKHLLTASVMAAPAPERHLEWRLSHQSGIHNGSSRTGAASVMAALGPEQRL